MSGLTVEESVYYASRLKNLEINGQKVKHKDIVRTSMKDFAIEDIKDVNISKCKFWSTEEMCFGDRVMFSKEALIYLL